MRVVNKWNLGLHKFAETGRDGRYALSRVSIAKDGTSATDGRGMVKVDLVEQDGDVPEAVLTAMGKLSQKPKGHESEREFLIDRKLAQRLTTRVSKCLKNPLRKNSTIPGVAYIGADGTKEQTRSVFVIPGEDIGTLDAIRTEVPTANYPNVDKVIPEDKPLATVDINGKLLGEILKYLGEFAHFDSSRVTLSLHKGKDSEKNDTTMVKVKATNTETGQKAVGVVMPFAPK